MSDDEAQPTINETGKVMFVRDADGELHVVKPGQPLPAVAKPPSASYTCAGLCVGWPPCLRARGRGVAYYDGRGSCARCSR